MSQENQTSLDKILIRARRTRPNLFANINEMPRKKKKKMKKMLQNHGLVAVNL